MDDCTAGSRKEMRQTKPKVLITGITGFIGEHLALRLLQEQWEVQAIVRPSSRLDDLPVILQQKVHFYVHDTKHDLVNILREARPDLVIHLASVFLSKHKYEDIDAMLESNVIFGTKLLDAMVQQKVYRFINTGTAWQHYENQPYSPVNLYAASKQAFEMLLQYYQETAPLRSITLKLFDTYGDGDKRKKLLALLAELAKTGKTLAMSPGEQKIDLVHVDDVVEAFWLAANYLLEGRNEYCGTYAVTSGTAISLKELVARYEKLIGKPLSIEWGGRPYREREVMEPWTQGNVLPGWDRKRRDLM